MLGLRTLPLIFLAVLGVSCSGESSDPPAGFDSDQAERRVGKAISADDALASLDRKMDRLWSEVERRSRDNVDLEAIRAEQVSWRTSRNLCSKSEDLRSCLEESYRSRIAEIQARWRLVPFRGPFFFAGLENPADEVVATFFETDPPSAVLERGDRSVVAFRVRSGSGARYAGGGVTFWNKGDSARVTWGEGAGEREYTLRAGPR